VIPSARRIQGIVRCTQGDQDFARGAQGVAQKGEEKMKAKFAKIAAALALAGVFAVAAVPVAPSYAAETRQCIQQYDATGAPVAPYCS
jgi:hypothetical protein